MTNDPTARHAHVRRMVRAANDYQSDANLLASDASSISNGATLLNLTAFEILLKALLYATEGILDSTSHKYAMLFGKLRVDLRSSVEHYARTRIQVGGEFGELLQVLEALGNNFSALRYPYEKYLHLSDAEYATLGEKWAAQFQADDAADGEVLSEQGFDPSHGSATFIYIPEQLFALSEALEREISACLSTQATVSNRPSVQEAE